MAVARGLRGGRVVWTSGLVRGPGSCFFSAEGLPDRPWCRVLTTPERPATYGAGVTSLTPARRRRGAGWVVDHAEDLGLIEPGGATGMSFFLSFHLALLGPTGAHWLDGPPDLSDKDSTRQRAADDPLLSCKQQVGGSSPPPALKTAAVGGGVVGRCSRVGGRRDRHSPCRVVGRRVPRSSLCVQGVGDGGGDLGMGEVVLDGVLVGAGVGHGQLLA